MKDKKFFLKYLFANNLTDLVKFNRTIGIHPKSPLEDRLIGLFLMKSKLDFLASLKLAEIINELQLSGLDCENKKLLTTFEKHLNLYGKSIKDEYIGVLFVFFIGTFSKSFENPVPAVEAFKKINGTPNFLIRVNAGLRLLSERPQFLSVIDVPDGFISIAETLSAELQRQVHTQALSSLKSINRKFDYSQASPSRILFLLGHAQPLYNIGSHWRQAVSYAVGFAKAFPKCEVKLLVTNECTTVSYPQNYHALPPDWRNVLTRQAISVCDGTIPQNLNLALFSPVDSKDYLYEIKSEVVKFSPDFSLAWLGFFSSSLFSALCSKVSDLYTIEFQVGNKINDDSLITFAQGYPSAAEQKKSGRFYHRVPMVPQKRGTNWVEGLVGKGEFGIVTTLGNGRLEKAINSYDDKILSQIIDLFDEFKSIRWFFIGASSENLNLEDDGFYQLESSGRIKFLAHVDDLRAFYSHMDLYVHLPKMHGGGWGIALAAFEGKPVLAPEGIDSDNFLPTGSRYPSFEVFLSNFRKIINNKEYRATIVKEQNMELDKHDPIRVARSMYKDMVAFSKARQRE